MKLAFVCQPWDVVTPSLRHGASLAIVAYELARRLARRAEVVVFARRGPGQPGAEVDDEGVHIQRTGGVGKAAFQLLDRVTGFVDARHPLFASPRYYRGFHRKVGRALREGRFDAVHLFSFAQHVPLLRAESPRTRIALHMQGESLTQLDRDAVERQIREADLLLGCSDYITEGIARRFPHLAERCRTLYNGVDAEHFRPAEDAQEAADGPSVLFVGRVSPEKGVHVLLDAFALALEEVPGARLEVVGGASLLPYAYHVGLSEDPLVRRLSRFYGSGLLEKVQRQLLQRDSSYAEALRARLAPRAAERVRFHGAVHHRELLRLYGSAGVFAFPSVWNEPFGMPVAEAMACGLPVVATRGGGLPELVAEGETGLLVERGDHRDLAKALVHLLRDPALRRAMGRAGRERAKARFGWERVADALLAHLESARRL